MKTKLWVAAVCLLLVLYLVVLAQRSVTLLAAPEPVAKLLGGALFVFPFIGAWVLIREILFGARAEQLAKQLESEGGLPVDDLPRTDSGRISREVADQEFARYQAAAEASPEDWRQWFRLAWAYDAARDRKRARAAMRQAIALHRNNDTTAEQLPHRNN